MPQSKKASDQLGITLAETAHIQAYQSGGLVRSASRLLKLATASTDDEDTMALILATYLTTAAALEALLLEATSVLNPTLYAQKEFRQAGAPKKYSLLKGTNSNDASHLWSIRIAVAHGEPENPRTRFVGEHLTVAGAQQAVDMLNTLARDVWGPSMPQWFSHATGLTP